MAIDKAKLADFAKSKDKPRTAPYPMRDQDPKRPVKTGSKPHDFKEEGDGRYGALIPLLEHNATALEECCDELDEATLVEPTTALDKADEAALKSGYATLDDELKAEMERALPEISLEDALKLAQALEDEDMITDADRVAGYLVRIGSILEPVAEANPGEEDPGIEGNGENEIGNEATRGLDD